MLFAVVMAGFLHGCDDSGPTAPDSNDSGISRWDGDYGNDDSGVSHDNECDDNRFVGPRDVTHYWSSGEFNKRDATDCRRLHEEGRIRPREPGDPEYLEAPTTPGPSSSSWKTYACDNVDAIWRGNIGGDNVFVIQSCQAACAYINDLGPDSDPADTYCNTIIPGYDDTCAPGACDFRAACVPCENVPR